MKRRAWLPWTSTRSRPRGRAPRKAFSASSMSSRIAGTSSRPGGAETQGRSRAALARHAAITQASPLTRSATGGAYPICSQSGTPMANWCSSSARTVPAFIWASGVALCTTSGLPFAVVSIAAPSRRWALLSTALPATRPRIGSSRGNNGRPA